MSDQYELVEGPPSIDGYLKLRVESGLSPKTRDQAEHGLSKGWAAFHVVERATGVQVAMGRAIGDGIFFQIVDMAVLPSHQRRGLGARILGALLDKIDREAPRGAYTSLMADPPGRGLYAKFGFVAGEQSNELGMYRVTAKGDEP